MPLLIALVAFFVGIVVGAGLAWLWLRRPGPAAPVEQPAPPVAVAPEPPPAPEQVEDLRPVLEATRGVVSALEERYQGARAEGDEDGARRRPAAKTGTRKPRTTKRPS